MDERICSVDDCPNTVLCRGWCNKHYKAATKYGDPLAVGKMGRPAGPVKICSIDTCTEPICARGWCEMHYRRWQKSGDPLSTKRILGDIEARFWSKVDQRGVDDCWPWLAEPDTNGYGVFGVGQKVVKAHVWAYERFVGPVPADRPYLDHACHGRDLTCTGNICPHRLCVNYLRHLEPVTNRENCLRGRRTKLSDETVAALYERWRSGEIQWQLAAEVGVNRVSLIRRFRRIEQSAA